MIVYVCVCFGFYFRQEDGTSVHCMNDQVQQTHCKSATAMRKKMMSKSIEGGHKVVKKVYCVRDDAGGGGKRMALMACGLCVFSFY